MKLKKGQGAVDFLIILSIALVIFLALWSAVGKDRLADKIENEIKLSAFEEANKIYFAVVSAYVAGDGYNQTVYLSERLARNVHYNVTINKGFLVLDYSGKFHKLLLPTKNLTSGQVNGTVVVKNTFGGIQFV